MVLKPLISQGAKLLTKSIGKKGVQEATELLGRQTVDALGETFVRNPEKAITFAKAYKVKDYSVVRTLADEASETAFNGRQVTQQTNFISGKKPEYKYEPFQVDETLPIDEQKRIYKQTASDYIYAAEQAEGKTVPVSKFFKEKGKLRIPDEGELDLKWKKKIDGKKDFQPKLKKTTAKETALRKSREKPWITKKSEIEDILKELGQEDKLDQLIKLIRSQYNKKVKQIKASGLSKGHQKSLEKGGWDIPENIIGEQGVSTKEVRGNYARQYKEDLPDEELMKQGAFVGTLKEYILMKLKELE